MVQFIQEFHEAVSVEICSQLIKKFDYYESHNEGQVQVLDKFTTDGGGANDTRTKKAKVIYVDTNILSQVDPDFLELVKQCVEGIYRCVPFYVQQLKQVVMAPIQVNQIDFLKYEQGEGFYGSHIDCGMKGLEHRILSFVLYLNDVKVGGETEFVLQDVMVKPEAGKLVIFPSNFCFVHQSNRTVSNVKYIIASFSSFAM
jgi:predicted 2-oxoglutarate/Fe(II)-dependent dioxygenase YbiX